MRHTGEYRPASQDREEPTESDLMAYYRERIRALEAVLAEAQGRLAKYEVDVEV